MTFHSNFIGYVDYLKSEGWRAVNLNTTASGIQTAEENWVIYDNDDRERARAFTEDDAWEEVIDDERVGEPSDEMVEKATFLVNVTFDSVNHLSITLLWRGTWRMWLSHTPSVLHKWPDD
jgi:hypothetical protein